LVRSVLVEALLGPAAAFHHHVELVSGHAVGTHKHEVLEQVGEPGAARGLVLGADVEPGVDGHHGLGVVRVQDHRQAVGQGDGFDVEGCGDCGGRDGDKQQR